MHNTPPIDILIVEDNEIHLYLLDQYLNFSTLNVGKILRTSTVAEAIELLKTERPQVIFLDLFLPDSEGLGSYPPFKVK